MTAQQWDTWVKSLGGTPGVWLETIEPDGSTPDPNAGLAAAQFPIDIYHMIGGTSSREPSTGVTYTFPDTVPDSASNATVVANQMGTLVYVLAQAMAGDTSVDDSLAGATSAAGATSMSGNLTANTGSSSIVNALNPFGSVVSPSGEVVSGVAGAVDSAAAALGVTGIANPAAAVVQYVEDSAKKGLLYVGLGLGALLLLEHVLD